MLDILQHNVDNIKTLEKAALEVARQLMEKSLKLLEERLFENKPDHLEVIHFKERKIATKVGEITFRRRYYRDKKRGENRFLLDEQLGLRKGKRVSGEFLALLVSLSNKLSFRQVAEVIDDADFPSLSHAAVHKEVREFGERESEKFKEEKERVFTQGKDIAEEELKNPEMLFIEADGILLSSQEEDKKRMEIKVGLMHEGWEYTTPAKKRKKLINPRVISGVYDDAKEFWEEFSAEVSKYYNLEDTLVVLNGDGAGWIQKTAKDYFPEIIIQLDRYHIKKDIAKYFNKKIADDMYEQLVDGNKEVFIDTLESLVEQGRNSEIRRKRRKLVKLYKRHEEHLLDYRMRLPDNIDKSNLHGLGAIESYVDKIIARRMKSQGMSWSREGAESMARILMLNQLDRLKSRLSDRYYSIENPVRKLKTKVKKQKRSWTRWLKASMPALRGPDSGKSWIKGLASLATV